MLNQRRSKGITLISLVITIIILLILAGILISLTIGENGIINKSKSAGKEYELSSIKEQIQMEILGKVDNNVNVSDNQIEEILKKYTGEKGQVIYENGKPVGVNPDQYPDDTIWLKDIWDKTSGELITNGRWTGQVNSPKLGDGMSAVIYDETTGQTNTPKTNAQWYEYKVQTKTTEDGGDSRWANAITEDGSLWVWIPRYSYKITSNKHSNVTGSIDIKFSNGTTDDVSDGYKLHPAFKIGDKELVGIWVAKFEMSMETNGEPTLVSSTIIGDVATNSSIKMVSKAERNSWRYITVNNIYTNCLKYNTNLESHMMKNIEWGCVAYLAHSRYGRNGSEITINNNNKYMTGYGGDEVSASETDNTDISANKWTGEKGRLASTTGNIYGIYDMSGGASEYVAGYIKNTDVSSNGYNDSLVKGEAKYKEVYAIGSSDGQKLNYDANASRYGDAVYEISNSHTNSYSWNSDYSFFPETNYPVFTRGGYYKTATNAGIFSFVGGKR